MPRSGSHAPWGAAEQKFDFRESARLNAYSVTLITGPINKACITRPNDRRGHPPASIYRPSAASFRVAQKSISMSPRPRRPG